MKRKVIINIVLILLITLQIFAEEHPLVKLAEYTNSTFVIRPKNEVAPQDDMTGNNMSIDKDGIAHIYNLDTGFLYSLGKDYTETIRQKLPFTKVRTYTEWYEESYSMVGIYGNIYVYTLADELKYLVKARELPSGDTSKVYYDEECDVLFFRDSKSNLYSIEHPSMDEAENQANFKGPAETIEMLKSGKYAPHLTAYLDKALSVDGLAVYWEGKIINKNYYQIVNEHNIYIFAQTIHDLDFRSPDEEIESITIHPCGDIYVLRMNWNTNTHILYRVENTWDAEWRASWYTDHPDAPGRE